VQRLHTKRSDSSHDDVTVLLSKIKSIHERGKPLILPPDDEQGAGARYEEEAENSWLEETTGRVLLGHVMLTLLWVAVMAAAIAMCV
jgi:hypothetical protein